jgi:TetR/AcrR family transcriptional repressor of nem operon
MRYPPDRKPATRRRILEAASQAFRECGVAETGVDEVMRRAGLTHGGFYAHFRDKAELVAEACAVGFAEAVPNLERIRALPSRASRVRLLVDSYLAPRHRDNRSSGCLIVAVAADLARLTGAARAGYSRAFRLHLARLAEALRLSEDPDENLERVTHLMSTLVGALLFARAVDDPQYSTELLRSMRRRLRAERVPDDGATEATERPDPRVGPAETRLTNPSRKAPERRTAEFCPSHDLLRAL